MRPGERAVSLRLRGGGPILLKRLRLSVQPERDGAGLTVRGGTTNHARAAVGGGRSPGGGRSGRGGGGAGVRSGPARRADGAARSRDDPGRAGPERGPGGPAEEAAGRRAEAGHSAARRPGDRPDRARGGDGRAERRREDRRRPAEGGVRPAGLLAQGADRPAAGDASPAQPRAAGEDEAAHARRAAWSGPELGNSAGRAARGHGARPRDPAGPGPTRSRTCLRPSRSGDEPRPRAPAGPGRERLPRRERGVPAGGRAGGDRGLPARRARGIRSPRRAVPARRLPAVLPVRQRPRGCERPGPGGLHQGLAGDRPLPGRERLLDVAVPDRRERVPELPRAAATDRRRSCPRRWPTPSRWRRPASRATTRPGACGRRWAGSRRSSARR